MAKPSTVRAKGVIRADLQTVARWCVDDQRISEWQRRVEAAFPVPIDWREQRSPDQIKHEAKFQSSKGVQHHLLVTRILPPPVTPSDHEYELKREITEERTDPKGRRSMTRSISVIRLIARDPESTSLVFEQRRRVTADFGAIPLPLLSEWKLWRGARDFIRRCQQDCERSEA